MSDRPLGPPIANPPRQCLTPDGRVHLVRGTYGRWGSGGWYGWDRHLLCDGRDAPERWLVLEPATCRACLAAQAVQDVHDA